jgi:phosphatidylglycerophosphatase A
MTKSVGQFFRKAVNSVFFLGYIPPAPGTVGSLFTVGVLWVLHVKFPSLFGKEYYLLYWCAIAALTWASMVLTSYARKDFNSDDPPQVIIDECVGQWITFFMVPVHWRTLILGFLLFRFFDIVKPFPINKVEDAEGGVGVTMDDVLAGVFANITLIVILAVYHAIKAALLRGI